MTNALKCSPYHRLQADCSETKLLVKFCNLKYTSFLGSKTENQLQIVKKLNIHNKYLAEQDTEIFLMHYLFLRALNACVLNIPSATTDAFLQLGFQPLHLC